MNGIFKLIGALAGLGVLGSACFVAGRTDMKYDAGEIESSLRSQLSKTSSALSSSQAQEHQSSTRVSELEDNYKKLYSYYLQRGNEILVLQAKNHDLVTASGKQANCVFVQDQIRSVQAMLDRPSIIRIMSADQDLIKREDAEHNQLLERLSSYQQQLSVCNH